MLPRVWHLACGSNFLGTWKFTCVTVTDCHIVFFPVTLFDTSTAKNMQQCDSLDMPDKKLENENLVFQYFFEFRFCSINPLVGTGGTNWRSNHNTRRQRLTSML